MTREMKTALNSYYRDIGKALAGVGREKREIVKSIRSSVESYLGENPDAAIEDVLENFGSAEAIAEEYYNNTSIDVIRSKISRSRTIMLSVAVALAIALLLYIAVIVTALIANMNSVNGYYVDTIETVQDQDENNDNQIIEEE